MRQTSFSPKFGPARIWALILFGFLGKVWAVPDMRFDVVTFCCNCTGSILCQPQFNDLNVPTTNGHFIAMGTDQYRYELATNGNALAIYYNTLNNNYPALSGPQQAAAIDGNSVSNFTSTGPKPTWIVLNEISTGLWQTNSDYRSWLEQVVHLLATSYGYNVILYSPFANPGNYSADWQIVSGDAYIAVENYLSGQKIAAEGFSVPWCESQYQGSVNSYAAVGVPATRLILGEHYGQTLSGAGYGRAGVTSNQWDMAINARSAAIKECDFAGDLSYDWGNDDMDLSTNEMIHFEDTYDSNNLAAAGRVTAPYILIQPQSGTLPSGSVANFIVFNAGTAPTSYQWRFLGSNIPGATASMLSLTNVQVTNAGNYSVILSNSAGKTTSADAYLTVGVPPPIAYDPFAYAAGANLIGQANAMGAWTQAGPSGPQPIVQAGNLVVGGLAGPSGNSIQFGGNGISARFNPSPATNASSGKWYYSLAVRLADISTLNSSGVFWAGFNNSTGAQAATPTSVVTRIVTRSAAGGYNIGLDKSSGAPVYFVFSPLVFTTNDTVFLVGSYTFDSNTANGGLSQLWINPPPATFGLANAPSASLSNTNGSDLSSIASFVLFNRNANEPATIMADELRLGTSWAGVTPPAESQPPPELTLTRVGANSVLSWTTNAEGFLLQSEAGLDWPVLWTQINDPVYVIGGQFVVTNPMQSSNAFFRLELP